MRPIDKETSTDEETGEETVTVTWAASGEDVTGNADTASLLAELGALTLHRNRVDYKPTDEAAALCGFDAPQATVTILYLNDTGTEGTLTLTFGSENLDQTGLLRPHGGGFHHLPDRHRFGGHHSLCGGEWPDCGGRHGRINSISFPIRLI